MSELAKSTTSIADVLRGDKMLQSIGEVVPQHMTPERMVKVGLMALNRTPKLAQCSRDSFLQSMMDCSSLGLEPDGRRCHLIPYGNTCQLIIDYKGLIELAKRSGEVSIWKAETVKENDSFTWVNGQVNHEIDFRTDRGGLQCVYSIVQTKDGEIDTEVMTLAEVEAIRSRSKSGNAGPWKSDFEEMAKKTVIRRHSKRLTLSPEFQSALEKDGDQITFANVRDVTPRNEISAKSNPFEDAQEKPSEVVETEGGEV